MENITGYRELSGGEVRYINYLKSVANHVGETVSNMEAGFVDMPPADKRWLAIARTDLQKGFMALIRSVAKPEGF